MDQYKDYNWTEGPTDAHGFIYEDLKRVLGEDKSRMILDVGCGNGEIANRLLVEGYDIYGIDASLSGIELASRENVNRFFVQDINSQELPQSLQKKKISVIISTEVIEHLYDPRGYIRFCKNILLSNGGGKLILSTPYHGYLKNLVIALLGKTDRHYTALWDGGHIKFWSKKTITLLLEEFGLKVTEFRGSGRFPYLWKSLLVKVDVR